MTVDYGAIAEYCPVCGASVCLRKDGVFRIHGPRSNRCEGSERRSQIATEIGGAR